MPMAKINAMFTWPNIKTIKKILWLPGYKLVGGSFRSVFGMNHKEHVRKASTKVRSIGVVVTGRFGCVGVLAFRTIQFDHGFTGDVWQTYRHTHIQYGCYLITHWIIFPRFVLATDPSGYGIRVGRIVVPKKRDCYEHVPNNRHRRLR